MYISGLSFHVSVTTWSCWSFSHLECTRINAMQGSNTFFCVEKKNKGVKLEKYKLYSRIHPQPQNTQLSTIILLIQQEERNANRPHGRQSSDACSVLGLGVCPRDEAQEVQFCRCEQWRQGDLYSMLFMNSLRSFVKTYPTMQSRVFIHRKGIRI